MLSQGLTATEFARLIGISRAGAARAFARFRRGWAFAPRRLGPSAVMHCLPNFQLRGKQGAELAWAVRRRDVPRTWIVACKAS